MIMTCGEDDPASWLVMLHLLNVYEVLPCERGGIRLEFGLDESASVWRKVCRRCPWFPRLLRLP